MIKYILKISMNYIIIFILILIINVKGKRILNEIKNGKSQDIIPAPKGKIITKYLKNSIEIELNIEKSNNKLLIHFLPIDCEIKIEEDRPNTRVNVFKISNFNYEAFYISINKETSTKFKISPLIHSSKEENQNRNYPLIINSIEINDSKIPELNATENGPVFLYFNNELKQIKLLYTFKNNNNEHPIILSFFIKEKIKYKIEITDDKKNIKINRTINYKENIIIKPESLKENYNILITQDGKK